MQEKIICFYGKMYFGDNIYLKIRQRVNLLLPRSNLKFASKCGANLLSYLPEIVLDLAGFLVQPCGGVAITVRDARVVLADIAVTSYC